MIALLALAFLWIPADIAGQPTGMVERGNGRLDVHEASILQLQEALAAGQVTAVGLVEAYLARIAAYDHDGPALNAIVRLNPRAREEAAALDQERRELGIRGPLHGIPILLKDNYDSRGLPTTGGTLALAGLVPADDAFQVRRLRESGAVILGKTNLHELASGITTISSLGGQTRNPYDPTRSPGGSSGGTGAAVAASFAAVGWGTDTCGSIRIPSAVNNLFGLRPTKGLSSIDGILPLSHTQDTGGPLARTVTDLAIALDATVGRDPADPATEVLVGRDLPSFRESLDGGALRDARIGVVPDLLSGGDVQQGVREVIRRALQDMEAAGAQVVEVAIPEMDSLLARTSVIDQEFKFDLASYLAATADAPVDSLGEIIALGLHHEDLDGRLRRRNAVAAPDTEEYRERLARQAVLRETLEGLLEAHALDALAYPTIRQEPGLIRGSSPGATCSLSAHSGLPALSMPAGFTENALPVAIELLGGSLDDHRLVALAYAFEQAAPRRRAPLRTPPLVNGQPPEPVLFGISEDSGAEGPRLLGTFSVDLPNGALRYSITSSGVPPEEVHAFVLLRRAGTGSASVVARLSPPGAAAGEGSVELPPHLLHDLMEGNLELGLFTRDEPLGALRARLQPPLGK